MQTFDIYDYFNSIDVAEHCKSLGHTFDALSCAVIVGQSYKHTMAQKHAAYRAIISEYPDMKIHEHHGAGQRQDESVHAALGCLIALEEKVAAMCMTPEPTSVYECRYWLKGDENRYDEGIFSSVGKFLEDIANTIGEDRDLELEDIDRLEVIKTYLDSKSKSLAINMLPSGEILDAHIRGSHYWHGDFSTHDLAIQTFLEDWYIDIPIPFKKGDLVEFAHEHPRNGKAYVLQSNDRDNDETHQRRLRLRSADISDMVSMVFHSDDGSGVCCDAIFPNLNLRHCRRELNKGNERILKYVSHFLKDELCLCSLLKLHKYLLADKARADAASARLFLGTTGPDAGRGVCQKRKHH